MRSVSRERSNPFRPLLGSGNTGNETETDLTGSRRGHYSVIEMLEDKAASGISRRRWFSRLLGLLPSAGFLRGWKQGLAAPLLQSAPAQDQPAHLQNDRVIISPLQEVKGTITPTARFFMRNHHDQPELSLKSWKLSIEGNVSKPLELSFSDLIESPSVGLESVLECSGNRTGLVSNGAWEGVPMSYLLKAASPASDATRVLLEGADSGSLMKDQPAFPFARIVPLEKCLAPESMVALKLNGQFLPQRNGFPARALLPGWYAMDSVKWLRRIVLLGGLDWPESYYGSGMDLLYQRWVKQGGREQVTSRVSELLVNSGIAFPSPGENLGAGQHSVWGFAWAGPRAIRATEVSLDKGRTWKTAKLETDSRPFTWVRWSYQWSAKPGKHTLMSRAQDGTGQWQPSRRPPERTDGYELNWYASVNCVVA